MFNHSARRSMSFASVARIAPVWLTAFLAGAGFIASAAEPPPMAEQFMLDGKIAEGIAAIHEIRFEAILAGRRLIPHWRVVEGRGINFRRVFLEPKKMDLVRWVQGAAAVPYIEEGECTEPETWVRFQQLFRGQFIGFAIWFN